MYPPKWPYTMFWCDWCGEPATNSVVCDPDEHPGGCGGPITAYVVMPVQPIKGTDGQRWEVATWHA